MTHNEAITLLYDAADKVRLVAGGGVLNVEDAQRLDRLRRAVLEVAMQLQRSRDDYWVGDYDENFYIDYVVYESAQEAYDAQQREGREV